MERLRLSFFVLSLVLAGLMLLLVVRESRYDWKPFQTAYKNHLSRTAETEAETDAAGNFSIGVRQDWLPDLERADRCRTCHIGVENPRAPDQQPLAEHSEIGPHPSSVFGCTVCHNGEGYATILPDAHEKMVPTAFLESSCGKCHSSDQLVIDAPTYVAGSRLVERYNCNGCHQFADRVRNASAGPTLNGLNGKVNALWLERWLANPEDYLPDARMADFLLAREEIASLAAYLLQENTETEAQKSLIDAESEQELVDAMDDDQYDLLLQEGKTLFGRLRCLTCHKLRGRGGALAPELGRIALKTNRAWISNWLASPSTYDPNTIMPDFVLNERERVSVVSYLLDESEYPEEGEAASAEPKPDAQVSIEAGARLFVERGCYNCHTFQGVKGSADFAPDLSAFADKNIEKIDFGSSTIPHTSTDYVVTKLQRPRLFRNNLKMPDFRLKPEEIGRLATVVLAQTTHIPARWQQRQNVEKDVVPPGEAGELFMRYKCTSCHMINGVGGSIAPDLSQVGSKVKREWLVSYLLKPYAIRPFLEERMLRLNMPEKDAQVLAEYITLVYRSKGIDAVPLPAQKGDASRGRELFFNTYSCQNCHALGKDGGYFGPALDVVGDRLQPRWMNARLINAHQFEPDLREPVLGISEPDRASLLAFLVGLTSGDDKP